MLADDTSLAPGEEGGTDVTLIARDWTFWVTVCLTAMLVFNLAQLVINWITNERLKRLEKIK